MKQLLKKLMSSINASILTSRSAPKYFPRGTTGMNDFSKYGSAKPDMYDKLADMDTNQNARRRWHTINYLAYKASNNLLIIKAQAPNTC